MFKIRSFSKIAPLILFASFLIGACDTPDISDFSKQTGEMTTSIRQGIRETGNVLKTASQRDEFFLASDTQTKLKKQAALYDDVMKPTLNTLDSLDNYVDTLDAISKANKDSQENAKAIVGSIDGLVSSASSLAFVPVAIPDKAIQFATGLLALAEKFRTFHSFKKRVDLAADIVEGRYVRRTKVDYVDGKRTESVELEKVCTETSDVELRKISERLQTTVDRIDKEKEWTNGLKERMKDSARKNADAEAYAVGCGVIDLIKFTIRDLKGINNLTAGLLIRTYKSNNQDILELRKNIGLNQENLYREPALIENYKRQASIINGNVGRRAGRAEIFKAKQDLKTALDGLGLIDRGLRSDIVRGIRECEFAKASPCAGMENFVACGQCTGDDFSFKALIDGIPNEKFEVGLGYLDRIVEMKDEQLLDTTRKYKEKRSFIDDDFNLISQQLAEMQKKEAVLNDVLDSCSKALDAWLLAHAKLRTVLQKKSQFSVGALSAQVANIKTLLETLKK